MHETGLTHSNKKKGWDGFVNNENRTLCNDDAMDLLRKLLVYDHEQRLTCLEAMAHPYFEPVRFKLQQAKHADENSDK